MTKPSSFPNLEGLLDLACRNGVDVRPTLLRVLTDLYVQKPSHSAEEEAQYVELAQRLIESADAPTRTAVAARLSSYPGAPGAVLKQLAQYTGYTITPPLSPAAAAPQKKVQEKVQEKAQDNLTEDNLAEGNLVELFLQSGSDERRMILLNLDAGTPAARRPRPADAADFCRRLEAAALARDSGEFVRVLQRALTITPALAQRIVEDNSGEPVAVAAKALDMPSPMLARVLLFINPAIGHSVARVYELVNLYEEITPQAAQAMAEIWRGAAAKRRPAHRSVYYDDEHGSARASATPAHARTTRRSDQLAARFRTSGR
ncbi:MAG: DUF2336 domain-containing protein [Pseudolabrys sp.]